jgi:hypothetical protein
MDLSTVLGIINSNFPIETKKYNLTSDNILGIYVLKVQKNWTKESKASNIQINTNTVKDFFPVLENSENFPHTRLKVSAITPKKALDREALTKSDVGGDIDGDINYRRKIQNGYPYIQLSFGGNLLKLKNIMKTGDELIFIRLKENKPSNYILLLSKNNSVGVDSEVWISDAFREMVNVKPVVEMEFLSILSTGVITPLEKNKIYYGTPGTGKSHQLRKDSIKLGISKENIEVVTFHPEFDYFSFIGGYKPNNGNGGFEYSFVEQVFIKMYVSAWNSINQEGENKLFLLVIEEINRGNCAEIFGDIFQLLDRNSDYSLTPSKELYDYLIGFVGEGHPAILDGKLRLPPNLLIWATMNTSDQSLFPMDSAFKRRWTWKYMPIDLERDPSKNRSASFKVLLNDSESFLWLDFLEKVNGLIRGVPHLGEDKCLGNYFINPSSNKITLDEFIDKVLFYLWCDVFRDEESEFYDDASFYDLYENNKGEIIRGLLVHLDVEIH